MRISLFTLSRSKVLRVGLFAVMIIFVGRLFYLQVIKHDYYVSEAASIQISKLTINPVRGSIYAMDGDQPVPLVLNESVFTVFADPSQVAEPDRVVSSLQKIAGGNIINGFETGLRDKSLQYTILAKQVTRSQAELIKNENLVGVGLKETSRRVYPETTLAAQLLGYVDADGNGQYGVESDLQNRLAGKSGMLQAVTDVRRIPLTIGNKDVSVPAKDGDNLVLTIDRNIQTQAEQLLKDGLTRAKATKGSVLVMDPRNGSVLAMANMPTYDPSKYTNVSDYGVFQNGVVSAPYENGSVIKTLTMGAALDSGAVTPTSTYNNSGVVTVDNTTIRNVEEDPVSASATMTDVLHYSLNTGVVYTLQQMGSGSVNKQARDTLYHYFHDQYRFGKKTGIEQSGEAAGTIIGPEEGYGLNVRYANMTFGQGMDVTMIQMASAFSAAINGGTFYQPHLISGTLDANGTIKKTTQSIIAQNVLKPQTSEALKNMIQQGRKLGFFGRYDKAGYFVGGKTGTSQVIDPKTGKYSDQNSVGTYIGFGATDTPSYVIMVKVDDSQLHTGYEGTTAAGPIFNDLSNWMIDYLQIQPKQ